jgi:hypothetical protein
MIGTILPSILFYLRAPTAPFMNYLYVTILFFDLTYFVLLYRKFVEQGINPWTRKPAQAQPAAALQTTS